MFDIIGYNFNIFIDNLSQEFNIKKDKLTKLIPQSHININMQSKEYKLYIDINKNKYIILFSDNALLNDEYIAVKLVDD
tara:strand:- start:969 stop:1205 length:237 start_codon:yes stop_codon:yes gene_type:complete